MISADKWYEQGKRLFGPDMRDWKFVCPVCGYVAKAQEWIDAGAPQNAVGFSCIGRWAGAKREAFGGKGPGPCDYAGGGLFRLNPVKVYNSNTAMFKFAEEQ
jgi:hypothetical protein